MLKPMVRRLAATGIALASAAVLTTLGATGASAAATAAIQPGHVGVAANTIQAATAAQGNALAHIPAMLATPAHASSNALAPLADPDSVWTRCTEIKN
jgi:hypothetical protein